MIGLRTNKTNRKWICYCNNTPRSTFRCPAVFTKVSCGFQTVGLSDAKDDAVLLNSLFFFIKDDKINKTV